MEWNFKSIYTNYSCWGYYLAELCPIRSVDLHHLFIKLLSDNSKSDIFLRKRIIEARIVTDIESYLVIILLERIIIKLDIEILCAIRSDQRAILIKIRVQDATKWVAICFSFCILVESRNAWQPILMECVKLTTQLNIRRKQKVNCFVTFQGHQVSILQGIRSNK